MKNNYHRRRFFMLLAAVLGVAAIVYSIFYATSAAVRKKFAAEIMSCNAVSSELRFSCYKSAIQHYYRGTLPDIKEWAKGNTYLSFVGKDSSYAIFGTNCHTFYHAVGDIIAERAKSEDIATLVNYCSNTCTSACIMGLYKRNALIHNFESPLLERFYGICPRGSEHQCAHEIGHILHDKHVFSILRIIDDIGHAQYGLEQKKYDYQLLKEPDINAPFEECKKMVPEDELVYCYTGIGHNLFLFSQFAAGGYATLFKDCEKSLAHRGDCYDFLIYRIGINDAATQFLSKQFEKGRKMCDDAVTISKRSEAKKHCYLGVGGGIGLFLDSEYTNRKITPENIGIIQKDVLDHIDLCEESEKEYSVECYKGLLGTRLKKLYIELNLHNLIIEKILPDSNNAFEVVG